MTWKRYTMLSIQCFLLLALTSDPSNGQFNQITANVQEPIPKISFFRRQIRNYVVGQSGSITIIYKTTENVTVHWFRKVNSGYLPNTEQENMILTGGDEGYEVRHMASGAVKATTLFMTRVPNPLPDFPAKYSTSFELDNFPMYYQIDTIIRREVKSIKRENLDSITWNRIPQSTTSFGFHGDVKVSCSAILDSESSQYDPEITMYRMYLENKNSWKKNTKIISDSIGGIRKGELYPVNQEGGKYKLEAERIPLPLDYFQYQISFWIKNATRDDEGMYVCGMERGSDRTYVSTWVQQGQIWEPPILKVISCENRYDISTKTMTMTAGRSTCFRCRAYGYPPPNILLLKGGKVLERRYLTDIHQHLNILDGGLQELTYTLWQPLESDSGRYECRIYNSRSTISHKFKVIVQ